MLPPTFLPPRLSRTIESGLGVELLDESVPAGDRRLQPRPEFQRPPAVEIRERHTLLLDPGVIAEIEDAIAIGLSELDQVIVGDALEVAREDLARADRVEAARIVRGLEFLALAPVHRGAVR